MIQILADFRRLKAFDITVDNKKEERSLNLFFDFDAEELRRLAFDFVIFLAARITEKYPMIHNQNPAK